MKRPISLLVIAAGAFLTGCVSTSTFDEKSAELVACESRAKSELAACNTARTDAETKLAVATQELDVYRKVAEANKQKLEVVQQRENQLRDRMQKELTDKSVEIEQLRGQLTVRMLDKIVFRSGSADILPDGMAVLDKLVEAIADSTDIIRVEGHTDDTPISDKLKVKYPSNWELSAARASAVARYIETKHHVNPKRLESLGFSMYHPLAPNDTDENKQRNRRVEIVLKPVVEAEAAPAMPAPSAIPETTGKAQ
ncbi:MAG: OmpA family protein [Sulfuricaulis sp.]|uniref:OmpA/MotB family protein n=1 Tax=Sulfuricaulis sp. TaxID=2003553 RepID=UPI0025FF26F4|nr:OmpA family protein [Sulfuricaulis sp.]MCR4347683.1 OmpA family protein [Sulfuricaulis sp.]